MSNSDRFRPIADSSGGCEVRRMKETVLVAMIAVASSTSRPEVSCPAIETLEHRDAAADARAALAREDNHLLMLGGFVGSVPGMSDPGDHPTRMMDGTSDTTTEACRRARPIAEVYAAKYNETISQAD